MNNVLKITPSSNSDDSSFTSSTASRWARWWQNCRANEKTVQRIFMLNFNHTYVIIPNNLICTQSNCPILWMIHVSLDKEKNSVWKSTCWIAIEIYEIWGCSSIQAVSCEEINNFLTENVVLKLKPYKCF